MNDAKVVSETVKLNFWDLISMTSPLPWKQLALILLLGGGVITPSIGFLLHRIRKLRMSRIVILQYLEVHTWLCVSGVGGVHCTCNTTLIARICQ